MLLYTNSVYICDIIKSSDNGLLYDFYYIFIEYDLVNIIEYIKHAIYEYI